MMVSAEQTSASEVWLVELQDAIGPASADYLVRNLEKAYAAKAQLVIIRLDTPGGLDLSMRDIIKAILASPIPVVTYVSPSGSRAASTGTYIMYASHFAAMAPATNIGSSTPVSIGGGSSPFPLPGSEPKQQEPEAEGSPADDEGIGPAPGTAMERKVLNDAVAYIRGLAELRGRNIEWAEQTVRQAANLPAQEALEQNVIDIVAANVDDLLRQLDGQTTEINGQPYPLKLGDVKIVPIVPDWRHEFLSAITNPNVAYILLMVGMYGLILEFYNPGVGVSGVTGIICLLLGAFAMQMLPINYAGLALIVLGIGLMVVEAMSPSFGVFGIGGVVAFVIGSIILMDTDLPGYQISLPIIAAIAATSAGVFLFALGAVIRARKRTVTTGIQTMLGEVAEVMKDFDRQGQVLVNGEIWNATTTAPVTKGMRVKITAVEGLMLRVQLEE